MTEILVEGITASGHLQFFLVFAKGLPKGERVKRFATRPEAEAWRIALKEKYPAQEVSIIEATETNEAQTARRKA